jgi:hypothetical protein
MNVPLLGYIWNKGSPDYKALTRHFEPFGFGEMS